ncbi:MAG: 6-phospho 3-hexuloisomerase [Thermomicrobiales bacterium]|nr:MAG: 6-phospho 3-hexuloisomerase [Thermomicrobiales bacterium]
MMNTRPLLPLLRQILEENRQVLERVQVDAVRQFLAAVRESERIFLCGEGRSGLVMRCFAMRLMQLGFSVHVVGEATTPAITARDALIACSGSGETPVTCLFAGQAKAAGARVLAITAASGSSLDRLADLSLLLPAPQKRGAGAVPSVQYGATLFEQSTLLLCDAMALSLMPEETADAAFGPVDERHANLE